MAPYTTRKQLSAEAATLLVEMKKSASVLSAASDLFLSHSSKDKGPATDGAVNVLSRAGARVYADFLDPESMDLSPREFGRFISDAVGDTRRLVVLLSMHAIESRWVPWELGLAHGLHTLDRVAVWPVVETELEAELFVPDWITSEYLNVYPTVHRVHFQGDLKASYAVRTPGESGLTRLAAWLQRNKRGSI